MLLIPHHQLVKMLPVKYGMIHKKIKDNIYIYIYDHLTWETIWDFRYGKVFKSHLFFAPTVVSCDQDLNYFILQNEGKLFQCSYPKPIHGILGNVSMLVAVGDTHKRLRNVALSLVSITKSKPEFLNDIERIAIQILNSWKDKQQVMFCEEARKVLFLYYLLVIFIKKNN